MNRSGSGGRGGAGADGREGNGNVSFARRPGVGDGVGSGGLALIRLVFNTLLLRVADVSRLPKPIPWPRVSTSWTRSICFVATN